MQFQFLDVVTNPFIDRLPSSYAWSITPFVALGLCLGYVAGDTREHVAVDSLESNLK